MAKAVTEHISLGAKYDEVKKIISVSIVYFDLGKGDDYVYHGQNKFIGIHTHDELKITTRQRNALVTHGTEKIFPEYFLLRIYNMDDRERRAYESHLNDVMIENDVMETSREEGYAEGMAKGHAEGMVEGRAEGLAERTLEIAASMKRGGMPIEQIQQFTGLKVEEIEEL